VPRTINHHGKAVKIKPDTNTQMGSAGGVIRSFFGRDSVRETWEAPSAPSPGPAMVKDILKVKNLTFGDLTARNEEVSLC
jgi:hypothetical protein